MRLAAVLACLTSCSLTHQQSQARAVALATSCPTRQAYLRTLPVKYHDSLLHCSEVSPAIGCYDSRTKRVDVSTVTTEHTYDISEQSGELYIREMTDSELTAVLVHEYVHALQDLTLHRMWHPADPALIPPCDFTLPPAK